MYNDEKGLFVLVQQTRFRVLPGLGFGVGLVAGSCHLLFFSLGLAFCFSSYIVHLRCTSEGVVSMFNETAHSFLCVG